MEIEKKILLVAAILAAVAMASCVSLLNEGQDADSTIHVGDEVAVSIPTEGCKDVKSGLILFEYDPEIIRFIEGTWNIDALMKDVGDGEGVFAVAGSASIPSKGDLLELRFECLAIGQASINAKFTFKTASGDVIETVEPIVLNVSCDHDLEEHPATPATTEKEGNTLYYSCSKCGKYYSDAGAQNEIEKGSWIIPKVDPGSGTTVTVNFICDGKAIAEPISKTIANIGSLYHLDTEFDGFELVGDVALSGSPSGLIMTYEYQKLEQADSVKVYAGQDGGFASIAIVADNGVVPDGKLQLKLAYMYREPAMGLLVSDYDYVDVAVEGGEGTVVVTEDLSAMEHYGGYFTIKATYTSSDGSIVEESSRAEFTPE